MVMVPCSTCGAIGRYTSVINSGLICKKKKLFNSIQLNKLLEIIHVDHVLAFGADQTGPVMFDFAVAARLDETVIVGCLQNDQRHDLHQLVVDAEEPHAQRFSAPDRIGSLD